MEDIVKTENTVRDLIAYGLEKELIGADDVYFAANGIFDALQLEPEGDFDPHGGSAGRPLEEMLGELLEDAVSRGVIAGGIASRDLLDTRIMGILTPRPSEVTAKFAALEKESPEAATDYFYRLARDTDYIRTYRVIKDRKWEYENERRFEILHFDEYEYVDALVDDVFLKNKTDAMICPDFICGENHMKNRLMANIKKRAYSIYYGEPFKTCSSCLQTLWAYDTKRICPICGSELFIFNE